MKAKYALRALACFVEAGPGEQLLSADIAEREVIPRKFLESILRDLRHHGLLDSRQGRGGGYRLRRGAEAMSVASVLSLIDGPLAPVACLNGPGRRRCEDCPGEGACGIRMVFTEAHEATLKVLESTTIADLAHRTRDAGRAKETTPRYAI
jgi:Rrf2 family protein